MPDSETQICGHCGQYRLDSALFCPNCGTPSKRPKSLILRKFAFGLLIGFGLIAFVAVIAHQLDSSISTQNAVSTSPTSDSPPQESTTTNTDSYLDDHELHLVPNLFGRGAIEDGRTYSVALITSYTGHIPPATSLIVQGVYYAQFERMMILEDEQEKRQYLMCAMSPSEFEDATYLYHKGNPVRVMGEYHEESGMDIGLGFGLARVLRDCTVSDPNEKVVRPVYVEPVTSQSPNESEPGATLQSAKAPEPEVARSPANSDAQIDSSQKTAGTEQKALAFYNQKDYSDAGPLFEKACAAGDTNGCINLGVLARDGQGVTRDYSHAAALFAKSCDAGNVNGCRRLGSMYRNGTGMSQDYTRAVSLYSKACGQGLADACIDLGNMYLDGRGVEHDYPKAAMLFTKACNAGNAVGCSNLGVIYQNGWGVPQDQRQAFALYLKACDAGSALGCNGIATMYQDGKGVAQDYPKAFAAYSKSCDKGYAVGCSNLGVLYRNGYGIRLDLEKAKQLLGKGCSMGDQWGCKQMQKLP